MRRKSLVRSAQVPLVILGPAAPLPLVGRSEELATLASEVASSPLTAVTGAAGVGKTALVREVIGAVRQSFPQAAYIRCEEGDLACSVLTRAERALDVLPGTLADVLAAEPRLLVVDELHRLPVTEAASFLDSLSCSAAAGVPVGRIVAVSRDQLPLRLREPQRAELRLDGLTAADARALWTRLEELFGPTPQAACDAALVLTGGVPLALRREYSRAAHGSRAWEISRMHGDLRQLLFAAAILRVPATPAALAFLVPGTDVDSGLRELIRRQLIDAMHGGRVQVHDVVRAMVIGAIEPAVRRDLEEAAANLFDVQPGKVMAWEQVDGAALDCESPVERVREAVRHWLASGKQDKALQCLERALPFLVRRGAASEGLVLGLELERSGLRSLNIRHLIVSLLTRMGRVTEALQRHEELARELHDRPRAKGKGQGAHDLAVALVIQAAGLHLEAADPQAALRRLDGLPADLSPENHALERLTRARISCEQGAHAEAQRHLGEAGHAGPLSSKLRVLSALLEAQSGGIDTAKQALGRAAVGEKEPLLAAWLAECLAEENRLLDADAKLVEAERLAQEQDESLRAAVIRLHRARVSARAGRLGEAEASLRALLAQARDNGHELLALKAEATLAHVLARRGRALAAEGLATAALAVASQKGLVPIEAEAMLILALVALDENRYNEARRLALEVTSRPGISRRCRFEASWIACRAAACEGKEHEPTTVLAPIEELWLQGDRSLARGEIVQALDSYRTAASHAERVGRRAELARLLADVARLHLLHGNRVAADEAATRAIGEAAAIGEDRAVARALLVKAALLRDEGNGAAARRCAADALTVARVAALGPERYACMVACEIISRETGDAESVELLGTQRRAAASTMGEEARIGAERMLGDLGMTPSRPYRTITVSGTASYVSELDPGALHLERRELVIDGVREQVLRNGSSVADLQKRSLLKRLLFLFASAPGKSFTKEAIVERVWRVDYHPLRHDAALFTNIMRLRRLLGEGGEEFLRIGEQGYRLEPPPDFLFIEKVAS
ncbi:MAG: winged helix-turn-helix domain-containing protein [Deltaproteobacteria bacterium]|nr:winged helix-turn-helix domain-containing protein [Deltaproteobacteria bacterium]